MIDDQTVYRLLNHIACEVLCEMRDGKTLEEIDGKLNLRYLKKKDRIAVFEHMVERFLVVAAHLRTLKRQKRLPQPTHPPAPVIPFRPDLH
jgi:hypothetical protein